MTPFRILSRALIAILVSWCALAAAAPDRFETLDGYVYRVIRPLGQGAFGAVYEVERRKPGTPPTRLALKVFAGSREAPVLPYRALARASARGRTDHVLRIDEPVVGFPKDGDRSLDAVTIQTMDLADGALTGFEPLRMRPDAAGTRLARLVRVAEQTTQGLSELFALGLAHRDVKPANLLVRTKDGATAGGFDVRLGDLDSLYRIGGETRRATFTPLYAAPEVADPKPGAFVVRAESDVYSLACSLYQLLFGEAPLLDYLKNELHYPEASARAASVATLMEMAGDPVKHAKLEKFVRERFDRYARETPLGKEELASLALLERWITAGMTYSVDERAKKLGEFPPTAKLAKLLRPRRGLWCLLGWIGL